MKLKQYPKYKDSGIQWIGKIPEGWELNRGKFQFRVIGGYAFSSDDFVEEGVPLVRIGDISGGTISLENCRKLPNEYTLTKKPFLLNEKDVLIAMTGATIGKIGQVPETKQKMLINQRVGRVKTKNSSDYYKYVLSSDFIQEQIRLIAEGSAQENISSEQIENFVIPKLNKSNQQKIASFLDKKTARIDTLIEKDKKLIALLKEKRTALINHVVTKGLDPKAKMKYSGVNWIGEIPVGWEVRKLKFTLSKKRGSIKTGPFGSQLTIDEMYNHEYKVYNQRNIITKDETIGENYVSEDKFKELSAFKVGPGDLLITTRGTIGRTLRLSKNAEIGILHPCLMKILIEDSNIVSIQLFLQSNATTIDVIYQDNLKEVLLPIPLLPEQTAITNFLDQATTKIDKTIKLIEKKIKLLEEYKKSLIHYVVTGKVDVRGVEA